MLSISSLYVRFQGVLVSLSTIFRLAVFGWNMRGPKPVARISHPVAPVLHLSGSVLDFCWTKRCGFLLSPAHFSLKTVGTMP
jgi:hypothetical protein